MSPFSNSYAVVIGISDYRNGIAPLKTAVNDATQLAQILKVDYQYTTTLLVDEQATRDQLTDLLQSKLPQLVQEQDRLLFYFAGHGIALNKDDDGPQGYLIPQDARLGDSTTYLPMQKVADALSELSCRHCLVILDCCFAGAFHWSSTRKLMAVTDVIHKERYDRFIRDPAWQVLTSASHDQAAWDSLELKDDRGTDAKQTQHSPFAAALINALQGEADAYPPAQDGNPAGDGVLTATELYLYLRDQVEVITDARNGRQTPGIWCLKKHDKGEYIFLPPGHELNLPPAPPLDFSKNPYRGLEAFDEQHSDLFFGRSALTQSLCEFVAQRPFTAVLGASGSGKSSLVKAGLIPCLRQNQNGTTWAILPPFRPGESSLKALNLALESVNLPGIVLSGEPLPDHSTPAQRLAAWFKQYPQTHLLVVVDQFEELITLCEQKEEQKQFLALLVEAIKAHPTHFHCLITLRSDFEPQFRNTELEPYWQQARFIVPAMTREELKEAVEKPASAKVVYFEPHTLVDQLIDEVAQMPGALPLLSFTLRELYLRLAKRYLEAQTNNQIIERAITQEDYDQVGGVTRALTQRADQEYEDLVQQDPAYAETMRHVMLRLVAVGGELARRRVLLSELEYLEPKDTLVQTILQQFLDARLLVSGIDIEGQAYVEPAHDILVRGWQRLLEWRQRNQKNLLLQRELTPDAVTWAANNHNKEAAGMLWNGDPRLPLLEEIRRSHTGNWLNATETKFIDHSIQRQRNNRRRRWALAIGVSSALAVFSVFASVQQRIASEQRQISLVRQLAAQSEAIRESDEPLTSSALIAMEALNVMPSGNQDALAAGNMALLNSMSLLAYQKTPPLHLGNTENVALSSDGRYAAVTLKGTETDIKKRIQIKEVNNGRLIKRLNAEGDVSTLAFSPNRKYLIAASKNTAQIWEISSGKEIARINHEKTINLVTLSPDDKFLAVAGVGDSIAKLWEVSSQKQIATIDHGASLSSLNFSPDSQSLVSAGGSTAQLWQISNLSPARRVSAQATFNHAETDTVLHGVYSHDGRYIATSSREGARVWEIESQRIIARVNQDQSIRYAVFSPNDQFLATAGFDNDNSIAQNWEISSGKEISRMSHEAGLIEIAYSPDGASLITTSRDSMARIWQLRSQREVSRLNHQIGVTDVTYSPDGKYLVTAGGKYIQVWETSNGRSIVRVNTSGKGFILGAAYSPNGRWLATAGTFSGNADTAQIWEIGGDEVAQAKKAFELPYKSGLFEIAFSPDGKWLATAGGDRTARIWEVSSQKEMVVMNHKRAVNAIAFSPDGKRIATAGDDGTARIWEVSSGQLLVSIPHRRAVTAVAFSPDGKWIATASRDRTAQVWDASNGRQVSRMEHRKFVTSVSFSADGRFIATASGKTAQIWDVKSQQQVALMNHERSVRAVTFSPDGKFIATASLDGIVRIWVQPAANPKQEACRRLDRNLTADEWEQYLNRPLQQYHKTCSNRAIHPSLLAAAKALAESGDVAGAVPILQTIRSLEPEMDLNPETQALDRDPRSVAERLSVPAKVEIAKNLISSGAVGQAVSALKQAESLNPASPLFTTSEIWNQFCWFGSLHNQVDSVMFACDKAVSLNPKNEETLNNRGIARALSGDITGAIQDFQASLPASQNDEVKARRRQWVEALQRGENPFTPEELQQLHQDLRQDN